MLIGNTNFFVISRGIWQKDLTKHRLLLCNTMFFTDRWRQSKFCKPSFVNGSAQSGVPLYQFLIFDFQIFFKLRISHGYQTYLPTVQGQARSHAWLLGSQSYQGRSSCPGCSPRQGPSRPRPLIAEGLTADTSREYYG